MHAGVHDGLTSGKAFVHTHIETLWIEFVLQLVFDAGDQAQHVLTFLESQVKE